MILTEDLRPRREQLLDLMLTYPPASCAELATLSGWTQMMIADALRILRRKRLVYIASYERQPEGQKGRCIPIYAVGNKIDASPLPRIRKSLIDKRYRQRHAALISARRYPNVRTQLGPWAGL